MMAGLLKQQKIRYLSSDKKYNNLKNIKRYTMHGSGLNSQLTARQMTFAFRSIYEVITLLQKREQDY